jgi:hypothetical protein
VVTPVDVIAELRHSGGQAKLKSMVAMFKKMLKGEANRRNKETFIATLRRATKTEKDPVDGMTVVALTPQFQLQF